MKKVFVCAGGAGFIGSNLVEALLSNPDTSEVRVLDDFSSGKMSHLSHLGKDIDSGRLKIFTHDLTDPESVHHKAFKGADVVYLLAANPDARRGIEDTMLDLRLETILTRNVLEGMRLAGVKKIIFSSSGTVYGDIGLKVATEGIGERLPLSLYGAGKVASEALISAFCGTFGFSAVIYRFGNVVGAPATHGAIFDFINQLKEHPKRLTVLGDGNQTKPYLYVDDVVDALIFAQGLIPLRKCEAYNLAPSSETSVKFIVNELVRQMKLKPKITYGTTSSGWAGDIPQSRMNMDKLRAAGFCIYMPSDKAVANAIKRILETI